MVDALVRAVRGMLVVASVVILGSCSANPTESPEYQALEAELVQAQSTANQLSEDLTLAQDDLARLGSELEDALARGCVLVRLAAWVRCCWLAVLPASDSACRMRE